MGKSFKLIALSALFFAVQSHAYSNENGHPAQGAWTMFDSGFKGVPTQENIALECWKYAVHVRPDGLTTAFEFSPNQRYFINGRVVAYYSINWKNQCKVDGNVDICTRLDSSDNTAGEVSRYTFRKINDDTYEYCDEQKSCSKQYRCSPDYLKIDLEHIMDNRPTKGG